MWEKCIQSSLQLVELLTEPLRPAVAWDDHHVGWPIDPRPKSAWVVAIFGLGFYDSRFRVYRFWCPEK